MNKLKVLIEHGYGPGVMRVAVERDEQINKHGFSLEEDAKYYAQGELVSAALFCLNPSNSLLWPADWDAHFMHKILAKTEEERLVVAGAFICAELDRLAVDNENYKQDTDTFIENMVINMILDEVKRAETKHPKFAADPVHRAAVVCEEAGELVRASLQYEYERGPLSEVLKEAIQTAATCVRILKIAQTLPVLMALKKGITCTLTNEQEYIEPRFNK